MKIPLSYTWRSLWTRRLTTILTLLGISLVVFVFAAVLMMAYGVEKTMVDSGSEDNVIAIRRAATSEILSQLDREAISIVKTNPELALSADGKPVASAEVVVVINLHKQGDDALSNVAVRGISPEALQLRPHVKITSGSAFHFGTHEIMIGNSIAKRFKGCEIGSSLAFGGTTWTIVGIFEAGGTAFESEIWGDAEQFMPAFGRPIFNTLTFRLSDINQLDALNERLKKDPRTQYIVLKREREFFKEQSGALAGFIRILGIFITVIFSFGAVIGAVITMYSAVANRTREIGTLRSLGFRRRSVLTSFLVESIFLSILGGAMGIGFASLMSFVRISTVNFGSFSELAFGFDLSLPIIAYSMIFSIFMGIFGGFFPALRAARLNIVNALRAS